MWKDRRKLLFVAGFLGLLMSRHAGAVEPKGSGDPLSEKEFFKPELYISSSNERMEEVLASLPNRRAWESFMAARARKGEAPVHSFIDPRSGAATNLMGAFPLIPGSGAGNRVSFEELTAHIGRPVRKVDDSTVGEAVSAFAREHAGLLGIDPAQLGAVRSVQVSPHLWQVTIPQTFAGIPVRHGRLAASISHGNLVVIGTETWGNVRGLATVPRVSAGEAMEAGFEHAGGRSAEDEVLRRAALEILPVAPPEHQRGERFGGHMGTGYRHRLVWTFVFRRPPGHGLWEVIVDARDGEVLAFQDVNQYANSAVTGGVYPLASTEICPGPQTCGTMQSGWPMPFADTGLAAPNNFTNSAGIYNFLGGTATTTLAGRYVRIVDACGAISNSSTAGPINLGGVNGQHDCTAGGGSAGNTASSRSAFHEVNKLAEMARGWLPANPWLQSQLLTNVNLNSTCNAFWDGASINFYRSGGGCRNTGEIASIIDHEWGHGLDANDAGGALSNSSEAYADIAAMYRLQASCLGHGTFATFDAGCGQTSDGTGFNSDEDQVGGSHCNTDCSGFRDADWFKHADHTPDTAVGFVCNSCGTGPGPCGRQVHCAAAPSRQAAWDFAVRDLQAPPFSYDSQTAFLIANKIFYQGSGNIGDWHACTCGGSSNGCGAANAYIQWLAADDDNGNLNDGTPHMTALYEAFDRHGIACAAPSPVDSGCAGGPGTAPSLTATAGNHRASLSWNAVSGATRSWVFRSEGHAGCSFGKTLIAEVTGTTYTDLQVANGRDYFYNVVAAGSSSACFSPVSNCLTVTPFADGSCYPLILTHTGAGAHPTAAPDRSDGCALGRYHSGTIVQLTAAPDPGHIVGSWTGTIDDAGTANVNTFTMPAARQTAAVHYVQPIVFASFDFESDPGLSLTGLWHRTTACDAAASGHSQPTALFYGIDAQCNYDTGATNSGSATLPSISLTSPVRPVRLDFKYFLATEDLEFFDIATVEASADGGPYQIIARNTAAPFYVFSDPSGGWKPAALNLPEANSTVALRFRFDTVDDLGNAFPGFYVDDVRAGVTPTCQTALDLNLSNQTVASTQLFEACRSLTAGTNFVVGPSGDATFHAIEKVALGPGFKFMSGGKLKVVVP